jgi:hypothetical protein
VTRAEIELIGELRAKDWSFSRIARKLSAGKDKPVHPGAVGWICLRHGFEMSRPHPSLKPVPDRPIAYRRGGHEVRRFTAAEDSELTALDAEGLCYAEIGRRLGRKRHCIEQRLMTLARREARAETQAGAWA